MPLNESQGYVHSNLTEKQQREAEKALYGLESEPPIMSPETISYEERVKMRRYLDQMDAKDAANSTKEFDLNNPRVPAYQYREFPFLMYHHQEKKAKPARNPEERERMLAEGWSVDPFPAEMPEIPLSAAEQAQVDEIDKELKKKRRP